MSAKTAPSRPFTTDEQDRMRNDPAFTPADFQGVDGVTYADELRELNGYGPSDCQWCGLPGGH
jgi:hypothetical protein